MENKELTLRITERIKPFRKRSERIVGYVPYTLAFEIRRYNGTSQKPEKVSILEKTITNLVGKGVTNIIQIAESLGLDMTDEIEKEIVNNGVEALKTRLQLLQGKSTELALTATGKQFIEEGEYIKKFSRPFEIFIYPQHLGFMYLSDCVEKIPNIKIGQKEIKKENLPLAKIKEFAEYQASFVQFPENGIQLLSADFVGFIKAKMSFYVCFVQSIRDNSVRAIIYDESSDSVIPELSQLFDQYDKLRDNLLKQCLKNEVKSEEAVQVESGEKTEEQIVAETKIIEEADVKGEEMPKGSSDSYENKVGTIYESLEFEKELQDIFEKHQNDEIWLISPWIRNYAFLNAREPQIRKFLDQGGAVFIGYSEPEKPGEEMVDPISMSTIKRLDFHYDKFYYAELPKFHNKDVIEQKSNKTSLYTGSFNILSFNIEGHNQYYRRENMVFANRQMAINSRQSYLQKFAERYVKESVEQMKKITSGTSVNLSKLGYLKNVGALDEAFTKLEALAKECDLTIKSDAKPNEEGLITLANKVLATNFTDDPYHIQARLASMLLLHEKGKAKKNAKMLKLVETEFNKIVNRTAIYKICRITMRRGKENAQKTIVNIICNGFNFEFGEFDLPRNSFKVLNGHKEHLNFREENYKIAKFCIEELLYNSAKPLGMAD